MAKLTLRLFHIVGKFRFPDVHQTADAEYALGDPGFLKLGYTLGYSSRGRAQIHRCSRYGRFTCRTLIEGKEEARIHVLSQYTRISYRPFVDSHGIQHATAISYDSCRIIDDSICYRS